MTTETTTTDPNPPPVDPAVAAAASAAAANPPLADAPADLPAPDPALAPGDPPEPGERPHGNKGKTPWYLNRISEESEARRQAEARAQELQAMLERKSTDPAAPAAPKADDAAIETRARQIAQETLNNERIGSVISAGVAKFADWDDRTAKLAAAGAATPAFVLDVVAVDPVNAHVILNALADDLQKAAHLAKMDTRTRTIELVKMSMAANQTAQPAPAVDPKPPVPPKTVSRAPPPPPPVDPGASQSVDWRSDKASDDDFSRGWEARQREKFAGGRR
jgi:hypothetical protein